MLQRLLPIRLRKIQAPQERDMLLGQTAGHRLALFGHAGRRPFAQRLMNHALVFGLIAAWAAIAAGCWLGWHLLLQGGRILLRFEALERRLERSKIDDQKGPATLPLGSPAPDCELPAWTGARRTLSQ